MYAGFLHIVKIYLLFFLFCYSDTGFDIILGLHVSQSGQNGSDNEIFFTV
jgi:hypothetical protein